MEANKNELVTKSQAAASIQFDEDNPMHVAQMMVKSGVFQDITDAAKAMAKIQAGRELGFTAVQSMMGIHFIKGRMALSATLIGSSIKRSRTRPNAMPRYDYRVQKITNDECTLDFFEIKTAKSITRKDGAETIVEEEKHEKIGESKFTIADAKKAGTQNTEKFPRNMLFARALTNGARWFTPDVFGGAVYTPDELDADVDPETGRVVRGSRETGVVQIQPANTMAKQDKPKQEPFNREADLDSISVGDNADDWRAQVDTSPQPKK